LGVPRPGRGPARRGRGYRPAPLPWPDIRDQAIAALGDRLDVRRRARRVAECLAQLVDRLGERLVADDNARPRRREQLFATDEPAGAIGEEHEHVHRLGLDAHRLVAAAQLVDRRIDNPWPDRERTPRLPRRIIAVCGRRDARGHGSSRITGSARRTWPSEKHKRFCRGLAGAACATRAPPRMLVSRKATAMTLPASMKQIAITRPGPPDVMHVADGPVPEPRDGEVLIEVAYAGVNRPDCAQRAGTYPPPPDASPVLGLEVAGRVAARGLGVTAWNIGDDVCALFPGGGYAQYCRTRPDWCLPIPRGFSLEQAAGLPENYFTVWNN